MGGYTKKDLKDRMEVVDWPHLAEERNSGRLFSERLYAFGFHKMRGFSGLPG